MHSSDLQKYTSILIIKRKGSWWSQEKNKNSYHRSWPQWACIMEAWPRVVSILASILYFLCLIVITSKPDLWSQPWKYDLWCVNDLYYYNKVSFDVWMICNMTKIIPVLVFIKERERERLVSVWWILDKLMNRWKDRQASRCS